MTIPAKEWANLVNAARRHYEAVEVFAAIAEKADADEKISMAAIGEMRDSANALRTAAREYAKAEIAVAEALKAESRKVTGKQIKDFVKSRRKRRVE